MRLKKNLEMKINYNYIKAFLVLALVIFLFGFAGHRNEARLLKDVEVKFTDYDNLYLTEEAVNKLLIEKNQDPQTIAKVNLDLNACIQTLKGHSGWVRSVATSFNSHASA